MHRPSSMARSWLPLALCVLLIHGATSGAEAAMYNVGDSAGWDISADFPSWLAGRTFNVGDVLVFQYSKYHALNEVDEAGFIKNCSTANAVAALTRSDGNTTVALTAPGSRHFVCGNERHCLGGMKLHVIVAQTPAPAGGPGNSPPASPGAGPLAPATDEGGTPTLEFGRSHRMAVGPRWPRGCA
ncbi:hypothetical protein ABZP36_002866 [Zizania latifolia]